MEPPVPERNTSSFMISDILHSTTPRKPKHITYSIPPQKGIPTHGQEREVTTQSSVSAGDIVDNDPGDSPPGESDYSKSLHCEQLLIVHWLQLHMWAHRVKMQTKPCSTWKSSNVSTNITKSGVEYKHHSLWIVALPLLQLPDLKLSACIA